MKLLNSLFSRPESKDCDSLETAVAPRQPLYRITEGPEAFEVRVELPGVSRDSLQVEAEGDVLTVRGAVRRPAEGSAKVWYQEVDTSPFSLRLAYDERIDDKAIRAEHADGVLRLTLPKAASAKARRIEIRG